MSHAQDHISEDLFDTSCEKCREELRDAIKKGEKGDHPLVLYITKGA